MRWPWQKKQSGPESEPDSARQLWQRNPKGLDVITGITPQVEPVKDDNPGEIYADEIDPEWSDTSPAEPSGDSSGPGS